MSDASRISAKRNALLRALDRTRPLFANGSLRRALRSNIYRGHGKQEADRRLQQWTRTYLRKHPEGSIDTMDRNTFRLLAAAKNTIKLAESLKATVAAIESEHPVPKKAGRKPKVAVEAAPAPVKKAASKKAAPAKPPRKAASTAAAPKASNKPKMPATKPAAAKAAAKPAKKVSGKKTTAKVESDPAFDGV